MRCFIQGSAGEFVAAAADATLDIGFTRLVTPWCQAEMGADIARAAEAVRPVDRGAELSIGAEKGPPIGVQKGPL